MMAFTGIISISDIKLFIVVILIYDMLALVYID